MSNGDVKRSQSASFFNSAKKNEDTINQRPHKRLREQDSIPTMLVEKPSTSTLIDEPQGIDFSYLTPQRRSNNNKTYNAVKLNRLQDKASRYNSHKEFLSQCIQNKLIPNGLKMEMEPTIGNHDQDFLDTWYSNLEDFSLVLMKQIVSFCDKTINQTEEDITKTKHVLKSETEKSEFNEIEKTINENLEASNRILRQRKFKKYNSLKYNPKPNSKTSQEERAATPKNEPKRTYANALKTTNQPRMQNSRTDVAQKQTLEQQLKSLHPKHRKNREKSPTRNESKTNQTNEEKQKQEIEQLKQQVKILKRSNEVASTESNTHNEPIPKNGLQAPTGGRQANLNITNVMSFIQETMKTLENFSEQLQNQYDINLIQSGQ